MDETFGALSRPAIAIALACGVGALASSFFATSPLAWLPLLVVIAALGWARAARAALGLSAVASALALASSVPLEARLLPLAAAWLLTLAAFRPARPREPAVHGRFEAILEHSDLLTLVLDGADLVSYANPAFLRASGHALEDLTGQDPATLFEDRDAATVREQIRAARTAGTTGLQLPTLRLRGPEERTAYLQARISPIERGPERGGLVFSGTEVTGRVRAEDALAGSETRLASLFATSRDALMIVRADDGLTVDFNEALTRLTGWTHDEGVGRYATELVRLADPGDLQRILGRIDADGEIADFETVVITREGRAREVLVTGRMAQIDDQRCVVAVLRDVTESRRTEVALAESEEKFSNVFHHSPDAMAIVRLSDGVILDVNARFTGMFARDHGDIVGRRADEVHPRLGPDRTADSSVGAARDPGSYTTEEIEFEIGERRIPTLVSTTVSEIHGDPCAISLIKDMSELVQARLAVEASERRFRGAFEHAPIGMMLVGPDGRIGQVNRMLCELLGYDEAELVGQSPDALVFEEDRDQQQRVRAELLGGGTDETTLETRYVRKDGSVVWTNRHVVLQRAADGTPIHGIVQVQDITDLKESRERMEKLAFYDTLTDLANRRLFSDRLEQAVKHAVRTGQPTALMYLDLDNFKRVNDSLGHEAGDELLRHVADRLRDCVRQEDTVGRFGGDEFTILLNQVRDGRSAAEVARKILRSLEEPILLDNHEFRVTTSIGVTLAPEDGTNPQTLTKNADLAMYRAKERGRDNYQFFSDDMNSRAMERLILENELRSAVANEEFELFYQTQIDVPTGEITGMEALVRWRHPTRGLLAPDSFIGVAEESGLIVALGEWTLVEACRQMHALRARTGRDVQIAVNISARQFADPNLPGLVASALRDAELPASALELEITETMLMHDIDEAIQTLEALHELGVSLAVDDFGTGYSSLNYLKRLPLDKVKVDRTFVSDIPDSEDDVAITAAVIAMAHQLKLAVVAEGVETRDQLDFLAEARCELAQGYLFGPPMPFAEAEAVVVEANAREGRVSG